MTTLTHRRPFQPVVVNVTITIRLDRLFWLLYAVAWLAWLPFDWLRTRPVTGLGRWLRGCAEWWAAAGVVARRRWRRWVRQNERRFAWSFSGLLYGPVLGVG